MQQTACGSRVDFSLKHLHFSGNGRAESSMSYDPRDHLVTSSDITFGIGLCVTLLACLAIFCGLLPLFS
jgi:hypothetical protein